MIRKALSCLLLAIVVMACTEQSEQEASDARQGVASFDRPAPVVTGTDQEGKTFSTSALDGSYWLASFMFTTCQTVCPALNSIQTDLAKTYASKGLRFVSISTDPANDTPEAIRAYAARYGATPGTWWMLTMPIDTVMSVATTGFAVMGPETPDMHSTRFVLIGPNQRIRDYFDSADSSEVVRLKHTLDSLLTN